MTEKFNEDADLDVSRETIEKLEIFAALVKKWTKSINLIAPNSIPEIWNRHIVDSAQIYNTAPKTWKNWIDLGSGGGFPAIVIAIMDELKQPMTLVESDKRKCLFLKTARRELLLDITVVNERIENLVPAAANILSARALAPLPELFEHAQKHLASDGIAYLSKGARYKEELDQAAKTWHFDVTAHQSRTNVDARILEISRIRRRES